MGLITPLQRLTPAHPAHLLTWIAAVTAVAFAWINGGLGLQASHLSYAVLLTPVLGAGLYLAYQFPIHVRVNTKVYVWSVVLYLMAVLLPPVVGAVAAGVSMFVGAWSMRGQTGNYVSDIATQAARWTIIVLLGSAIAHLSVGRDVSNVIPLAAAAVFLWAADVVTAPILFAPVTGQSPVRIMRMIIDDAGLAEAAQYLIGLMAALEASERSWTLALFVLPTGLVYYAFKHAKEMQDETRHILESMADTADLRDPYTAGHSRRVMELAGSVLREMHKHGPEVDLIVLAARVHDIGKMAIPDDILRKPGKLTAEERAIMQAHTEHGANLLARYPDFARGAEIIRHHHEAWDGSGYPHRLKGAEIPFGARVIAVVDSYDAMTTDRPYRRGMSPETAAAILRQGRGCQWDGQIVDAFLRVLAARLGRPAETMLHIVPDVVHDEPTATTA